MTTNSLQAQPPPAQANASRLPQGHPILHAEFFRFTDSLAQWYDGKRANLPPQAAASARFDSDIEKIFDLRPSELQAFLRITRSVNADVSSIDAAISQHSRERGKQEVWPVSSVINALQNKRDKTIADGMANLQKSLSAQGWAGVQKLINEPIRNAFHVVSAPVK